MQKIVTEAYATAKRILEGNHAKLEQIAQYLMLHETVEGADLEALFNSDPLTLEDSVAPAT